MESMRILKAEKSTGKSSFYLLISEASNKFDVMFGGYYFFAKVPRSLSEGRVYT